MTILKEIQEQAFLVFSLGRSNGMKKMVVPTELRNLIHLQWFSHYLDLEKRAHVV